MITSAIDDGGVFLADVDLLGRTQLFQRGFFETQANFFGDHCRAGQHSDVFQHGFAAVTEARRLNGCNFDDAADGVDHQGGQGFAFNVFSDDQQ